MGDFVAGVVVALLIVGVILVVLAYFGRRWFERTSTRIADDLGAVLADLMVPGGRAGRGVRPGTAGGAARARTSGPPHTRAPGARPYRVSEPPMDDAARRELLASVERTARLMDSAVRVPVLGPAGLDALLGLVPVAGDLVSAAIAASLILRAVRYGVPPELVARMVANVLIDLAMGAVPIAGDLADVWFRANTRNVALLRDFLQQADGDVIDVRAD